MIPIAYAINLEESTVTSLIIEIIKLINLSVGLLIAVAVIIFITGIIKYVLSDVSTPQKRENARWYMILGIVGFTVITGLWAIVNAFAGLFGLEATVPQFPTDLQGFGTGINANRD